MRQLIAIAAVTLAMLPSTASAQFNRILTRPGVPDTENLDRLDLQLEWKGYLPVEGRRDGIATLQLFGDQLLAQLRNGTMLALDATTGRVQWRLRVGNEYPVILPLAANDYCIVVARGPRLYGIQRYTGIQLWDLTLFHTPAVAPAMDEETIYVALSNGRIIAYLLPESPDIALAKADKTSKPVDKKPSPRAVRINSVVRSTTPTSLDARTSIMVSTASQSRTYNMPSVIGYGGRLQNLGSADRPLRLWDSASLVQVGQAPVVAGGHVLFAGAQRDAVIFRAADGVQTLEFDTQSPAAADPEAVRDMAYLATRNNVVYALNLPSSRLAWRYLANGYILQKPIANGTDLFIAADQAGLVRLNRETGDAIWQCQPARRFIAANPKYVYASDRIGQLLILDRMRGTVLTTFDMSGYTIQMTNDLTDRLFLAANDGTMVCLHDAAYPKALAVKAPDFGGLPVAKPVAPTVKPAEKPAAKPAEGSTTPPDEK